MQPILVYSEHNALQPLRQHSHIFPEYWISINFFSFTLHFPAYSELVFVNLFLPSQSLLHLLHYQKLPYVLFVLLPSGPKLRLAHHLTHHDLLELLILLLSWMWWFHHWGHLWLVHSGSFHIPDVFIMLPWFIVFLSTAMWIPHSFSVAYDIVMTVWFHDVMVLISQCCKQFYCCFACLFFRTLKWLYELQSLLPCQFFMICTSFYHLSLYVLVQSIFITSISKHNSYTHLSGAYQLKDEFLKGVLPCLCMCASSILAVLVPDEDPCLLLSVLLLLLWMPG